MDALGGVLTRTPGLSIIVQKRNYGAQYVERRRTRAWRAGVLAPPPGAASHTLIARRRHRAPSGCARAQHDLRAQYRDAREPSRPWHFACAITCCQSGGEFTMT